MDVQEEVTLICKDNEELKVAQSVAEQSQLVKDILEDNEDKRIDVSAKVSKPVCEKIMAFCEILEAGDQIPVLEKPLKNGLETIPIKFVEYINDVDKDMLFQLIEAGGTYMSIEPLLRLCAAKIANEIRDLYIVDIRKYFGC